jgi:undecaprenyl-diphosphatase
MFPTLVILFNLKQLVMFDQNMTLALNGGNSLFWDGVMVTATSTMTWLPLALVFLYVMIENNSIQEFFLLLLMLVLAILVADQFSSSFCKPYFARFRPAQDPYLMYQVDIVNGYRGGLYGFISSHAANTFALSTLVSLVVRSRKLTIGLFSWALLNVFSRVYLGVHYVGDIFFGALWGCITGFALYFLFLYFKKMIRKNTDKVNSSGVVECTVTCYRKSHITIILSVLIATYCFITIRALFFI